MLYLIQKLIKHLNIYESLYFILLFFIQYHNSVVQLPNQILLKSLVYPLLIFFEHFQPSTHLLFQYNLQLINKYFFIFYLISYSLVDKVFKIILLRDLFVDLISYLCQKLQEKILCLIDLKLNLHQLMLITTQFHNKQVQEKNLHSMDQQLTYHYNILIQIHLLPQLFIFIDEEYISIFLMPQNCNLLKSIFQVLLIYLLMFLPYLNQPYL